MPNNIRIAASEHLNAEGETKITLRDVSMVAIALRDIDSIAPPYPEVGRDADWVYFEPSPAPFVPLAGEVVFDHYPTAEEIAAAFPALDVNKAQWHPSLVRTAPPQE